MKSHGSTFSRVANLQKLSILCVVIAAHISNNQNGGRVSASSSLFHFPQKSTTVSSSKQNNHKTSSNNVHVGRTTTRKPLHALITAFHTSHTIHTHHSVCEHGHELQSLIQSSQKPRKGGFNTSDDIRSMLSIRNSTNRQRNRSFIMTTKATATASTVGSTISSGIPGVDYISRLSVFHAMLPILSTILISHCMELQLRSRVFVSVMRNFIQLSALTLILKPVFTLQKPILVMTYMLALTVLAAFEASRRTKYLCKGQFTTTLISLLTNVIITSIYAFRIVIKPTPFLNPQCTIPVCGMLLGNCINGVSLSLNSLTSSIMEKQREIELYLSFGATGGEAVRKLLRESIQAGLTPVLNNMSVMGLISIPGMMTGQILGGSSAVQAARWQMLIMYLIASSIFGTVLMQNLWTTRNIFSDYGIRKELLGKRKRVKQQWIDQMRNQIQSEPLSSNNNDENHRHNQINDGENLITNSIELSIESFAKKKSTSSSIEAIKKVFRVDDVTVSIPSTRERSLVKKSAKSKKILFQNLSFQVREGEIAFIKGSSGSGKSSLLRVLAKLSPPDSGIVSLDGVQSNGRSEIWRKHVRYLTQYKVDVPGTPMQSIDQFSSFKSWMKETTETGNVMAIVPQMKQETIRLIRKWNLSETILDQEWMTLSGGESQRIILAMAIASRPNVLLLDESTSALDQMTKIKVERTVVEEVKAKGMIAIWISHDHDRRHLHTTADNITLTSSSSS